MTSLLPAALDAIEERVQSLLSPWVNPFDDVDLGLDGEDLLG